MERWRGRVAVVTGASAGIGLLTAKALLGHGMIVVGLARRKLKMQEEMKLAEGKGQFHAIECDISKEADVVRAFERVRSELGGVHVLVNNAGLMNKGATSVLPREKLEQVINVNLWGSLHCTRQAVTSMRAAQCEGHVINVGSYLGHKVLHVEGFPMNVYPATKFAVRAFSESLEGELRGTPIRVTHISPGLVRTEFFEAAGLDPAFLEANAALDPEDVADAVVYVLATKPHVSVPQLTIMHRDDHFR